MHRLGFDWAKGVCIAGSSAERRHQSNVPSEEVELADVAAISFVVALLFPPRDEGPQHSDYGIAIRTRSPAEPQDAPREHNPRKPTQRRPQVAVITGRRWVILLQLLNMV